MRTEAFASPLTVWVGSRHYTFAAGRDVTVGRDNRCDVRLYGADPFTSPTHLVLRHDGRQWVAIDRSQHGIYVDGVRMSTVFIRDGRAITLGDPRRGLRLVFQLGEPAASPPGQRTVPSGKVRAGPFPPATDRPSDRRGQPKPPTGQPPSRPSQPRWPSEPPATTAMPAQPKTPRFDSSPRSDSPSQLPTRAFRAPQPSPESNQGLGRPAQPRPPQPRSPASEPPSRLPTQRFRSLRAPRQLAQPTTPPQPPPTPSPPSAQPKVPRPQPEPADLRSEPAPAGPAAAQRKGHVLVERMTGAMQRLIPRRAVRRPHEEATTGPPPRGDVSADQPPQPRPVLHPGALEVHRLGLSIDGQPVLADVSFTAQPRTLTAVIGPSETARAGLVRIVGGALRPGSGNVTVGGHDLHAEDMHGRIGMVPQHDLLHPQLTVEQALGYLAELRLPPNTCAKDRRQVVDRVLRELELTALRTIQVGKLTREQRKRASAAAELITNPSLLVLDEPTAGLNPEQQQQIMATLRRLADAGHLVVVSTTAVDHVDACDQVLMLTSTGSTAFAGPPGEIEAVLHTTSWPEIFAQLTNEPDRAHGKLLAIQQQALPGQGPATPAEPLDRPAHIGLGRQIAVAARRQVWLTVADQRYLIFLTLLPLLFGGLVLLVAGHAGLGQADPYGNSPDEALEILVLLNFGAVVMGTALTIRDVLKERFIFRREQADGLSATAYLAAKIGVYSLVAMVQTAITTTVAVAGKGAPSHEAVLLGSPVLELYLAILVTTIVSSIVALAISSLAKYPEQLMLMTVLFILISVLFSGGAFPLNGRFGLEQISWLLPSRWGFAASASTVDLPAINSLAGSDRSWTHSAGWWLFDMAMLIAFGVVSTMFLRWRLRHIRKPRGGDEHPTVAAVLA